MRFVQSSKKLPGKLVFVQENGRSAALLQRILEQPLLLSDEMLERGVSNLGSCSRVERAMHKLVAGAKPCF